MAERLMRGTALVLRRYPLGESDCLVVLLTREWGKLRVLAKGLRRSRRRGLSSLDLLSLADVELAGSRRSGRLRLSGGRVIEAFWPLARDPLRLGLAFCFAEAVERMIEPEAPVPEIFDLLEWLLCELSAGGAEPELRAAEAKLLALSGLLPPLDRCPRCGADPLGRGGRARFSFSAQAAFCGRCAGSNTANPTLADGTLRTLRAIAAQPIERLSRIALSRDCTAELAAIAPRLIERHLGRELCGRRVLAQLRASSTVSPARGRGGTARPARRSSS